MALTQWANLLRLRSGRGIFARNGDVTLTNSTVSGNSTHGDYAGGGGIFARNGDVTLTESTVSGNSTYGRGAGGGGIFAYDGDVTLTESTVSGNSTYGDVAHGGGIYAHDGDVTLTNSTVSSNTSSAGAAGIHAKEDVTLAHSTIENNAGPSGGVLIRGDATVLQSTISDNAGYTGISLFGLNASILHSTISNNNRGIFIDAGTNLTLSHTIVANNALDLAGDPVSLAEFNLVESADPGNGVVDGVEGNQVGVDPMLGPLADNGGPTLTHALLPGSPALDAGDPTFTPNMFVPPLDHDQRSSPFVRVAGGRVDIGSLELQNVVPDGDFNDDGVYDCLDIDALIAEIAASTHNAGFDLTADGLVNLADRDAWLAEAGEVNLGPGKVYLLGDATLDGFVDGLDFNDWNANKFTSMAEWCAGDFNADGLIDGFDLFIWNANKFQSSDNATQTISPRLSRDAQDINVARSTEFREDTGVDASSLPIAAHATHRFETAFANSRRGDHRTDDRHREKFADLDGALIGTSTPQ